MNEPASILVSPVNGIQMDEMQTKLSVQLKHVLPNTLFSISLTDFPACLLREDGSILDMQQYQEWASLEHFCQETGYTLETTIDAWQGRVVNPDWQAP